VPEHGRLFLWLITLFPPRKEGYGQGISHHFVFVTEVSLWTSSFYGRYPIFNREIWQRLSLSSRVALRLETFGGAIVLHFL